MCHPGRVNGSGLIGSPYSALEPISASLMMYTSLNACRQSRALAIHPDFQCPPRSPLPSRMRTAKGRARSPPFPFMYPPASVIYHLTNKGVQGRPPTCKHARAIVRAQSCVLSRSSSFAFNMHRAGGQRALLCIRSTSSNSKRHQSAQHPPPHSLPPAAILHVTMRRRAQ